MIRNILIAILCILPLVGFSQSKRDKKKADANTAAWIYDVELGKHTANQGSKMVKIWSIAPSAMAAVKQAPKNAVHAVIFKGVPANEFGMEVKPLDRTSRADIDHAAFFESFFADGGKYMQFVTLVNNGNIAPGDLIKVGKKDYKVGVLVTVRYDDLRKYLESEGIVKSLSSGF